MNYLTWHDVLAEEKSKPYFKKILQFIEQQRSLGKVIYPSQKEIFNAFYFTKLHEVKVVIIGQDPYHGPNQAHGLSFSVKNGIKIPPSLKNIYKELKNDISNFEFPNHGCLENWAKQGVLLLNIILTVEASYPNSHANLGWEKFTNKVISVINQYCKGVIFLLWGSVAYKKKV